MAKEFLRLVGGDAEDADVALRGANEPGHQVHEGGLARAVGSNQTGNARRQREIHTIDAQHLAIEAGDVLQDDSARVVYPRVSHQQISHRRGVHPRITSFARRRLLSRRIASQQTMNIVAQASQTGMRPEARNRSSA